MPLRKMTDRERDLLVALVSVVPDVECDVGAFREMLVEPLEDGGMGSLRLNRCEASVPRIAAEVMFEDVDNVKVLASLFVDQDGTLLELDIWKTNFEPLKAIPAVLPQARRFSYSN